MAPPMAHPIATPIVLRDVLCPVPGTASGVEVSAEAERVGDDLGGEELVEASDEMMGMLDNDAL